MGCEASTVSAIPPIKPSPQLESKHMGPPGPPFKLHANGKDKGVHSNASGLSALSGGKDSKEKEPPEKFASREEELIWHVRKSWIRCAPHTGYVATVFYTRLFELDPQIETLFQAVDLEQQGASLMLMLGKAIDNLDKPAQLIAALTASGRRHAKYGVLDYQYDTVGAALMWTLEKELGANWSAEASTGWMWVYKVISETMKRGARQMVEAKQKSAASASMSSKSVKDKMEMAKEKEINAHRLSVPAPADKKDQKEDVSSMQAQVPLSPA